MSQANKAYNITFNPSELDQLLTVLYGQTSIADQSAIRLIAKINSEVHSNSPLNATGQNLLSNSDFDVTLTNAEDTYRRYRAKHLMDRSSSMKVVGQDREQDRELELPEPQEFREPQRLTNTLDQIAQSLQSMMDHWDQDQAEPLGFFPQYRQRIVYSENQRESYWFAVDEDNHLVPIAAQVLTCKVKALEVRKGKLNGVRICLSVQADKFYQIEIPYHSLFGKALLLSLANLSLTQLRLPVTIEPRRSVKHQSVTCQLYCQGLRVSQWEGSRPHWPIVIEQIQQNLERILH